MKMSYTENDLIRFIYGETSDAETKALQAELTANFELNESFQRLQKIHQLLDEGFKSPSQTSIDLIMEHSRNTAPMETY